MEQALPEVSALLASLRMEVLAYLSKKGIDPDGEKQPKMVGIETGGVWVARSLHQSMGLSSPLGTLDISFYRDDFTEKGLHPKVKPSTLPFSVENETIILVDDVVMSGRTVRAALNELFDYGRPSLVILVVLIDLNEHQLPIQPDISGVKLTLKPNERVKLTGPSPLALELRQLDR